MNDFTFQYIEKQIFITKPTPNYFNTKITKKQSN